MFYVKIRNPSPTISGPVLASETAWRTDRYTVLRLASLTTAQSVAKSLGRKSPSFVPGSRAVG